MNFTSHMTLTGVAVVTLALFAGSTAQADVVIDQFEVPDPQETQVININDSNPFVDQYSDGLGGQRDMLIDVKGDPGPVSYSGNIGTDSNGQSALEFNTDGTSPGTVGTLQYDGSTETESGAPLNNAEQLGGGSGFDLTESGANDRFRLSFFSSDGGESTNDFEMTANVTSASGGDANMTQLVDDSSSPFDVTLPFSSFTGNTSAFSDATSVTFNFNTEQQSAVDFSLGQIRTTAVPAPSALASGGVLLLGLAGFGARRWR